MKNLLAAILTGIVLSGSVGCNSRNGEFSEEAFLRDSTQYERFQYFDYYTLTGKGEVTDTPYVFVKREKNRITVRLSDSLPQAYIFNKMGDYWHIRQEYEMEYAGTEPCLCINAPEPRQIDRFIKDDTVFQVVQFISRFVKSNTRICIFDKEKSYYIYYKDGYVISDVDEVFDHMSEAIKKSGFIRGVINEPDTSIVVSDIINTTDSIGIKYGRSKHIEATSKKGLTIFGEKLF